MVISISRVQSVPLFSGERSVLYNIMNYKLEITAIAARALSIDDMSRLET